MGRVRPLNELVVEMDGEVFTFKEARLVGEQMRYILQSSELTERSFTASQFEDMMKDGRVKIVVPNKSKPIPEVLTPGEKERATKWRDILHELDGLPTAEKVARIEKLKTQMPHISYTTFYRQRRRWIDANKDYRVLAGDNRYKGRGRGYRLPPDVEVLLDGLIEKKWYTRPRPTLENFMVVVAEGIERLNAKNGTNYAVPSKSTIRRRIQDALPLKDERIREGDMVAYDQFGEAYTYQAPKFPNEVWQIDHTQIDVIVVDEKTGKPIGRPWLTIVVDVYSRTIVGFYLGFEPQSFVSIMYAMENAISHKDWVNTEYPEIQGRWHNHGLPSIIICDRGSDFTSESFLDMCNQLDIRLVYCPARSPKFKPHVERTFRTLNSGLFHQLPGTTFSNPQQRQGYNSEKQAKLTLEDVRKLLVHFIVDQYHTRKHKGIGVAPAKRYLDGIALMPPAFPSDQDWRLNLGKVMYRTLHKGWIEFNNRKYLFGSEVNEYRKSLIRSGRGREQVKIKYNPDDISVIWVFNDLTGELMTVEHDDPEIKGLSLYADKHLPALETESVAEEAGSKPILTREQMLDHMIETGTKRERAQATRIKSGIGGTNKTSGRKGKAAPAKPKPKKFDTQGQKIDMNNWGDPRGSKSS